jgi:hypothetical protein
MEIMHQGLENQELFELYAPVVDVYCVLYFLNGRIAIRAGHKLALW